MKLLTPTGGIGHGDTDLEECVFDLRSPTDRESNIMADWLFEGMSFQEKDHPLQIYDKAIEMERRTRDYFNARAAEMPEGPQREIYRELAAEEEEHVALLETERAQFESE